MNNKEFVLQKLKDATKIKSLKLPTYLGVTEANGVVTLSMKAIKREKQSYGVLANMQQDDAAFEGWAICMKAAVPEWTFMLDWDFPEDKKDGHYQRFLYRAKRFRSLYKPWFTITDQGLEEIERFSRIKDSDKPRYILNAPLGDPKRTNDAEHSPENLIENTIIKTQQHELNSLFNVKKYSRQLPVGLFVDSVAKKNAIFTHGKSAIDIWGISDDKKLIIFELKALENTTIGAISELFFYAMVMRDEQEKHFRRESKKELGISETTSVKAMILAEQVHPFINNPKVFELMNQPCKDLVEFGYVRIPAGYSYKRAY
jgi:hypothetical protein